MKKMKPVRFTCSICGRRSLKDPCRVCYLHGKRTKKLIRDRSLSANKFFPWEKGLENHMSYK